MTLKDIQELIKLIAKTEISEFKYKDGDTAVHIRGKSYNPVGPARSAQAGPSIINVPAPAAVAPQFAAPAAAPAPAAAAAAAAAPAPAGEDAAPDQSKLVEIKSPMIGTFYRSSSPDKPVYVKVGDRVAKGDTVCIVEAMKLFNEIESEVAGKIVKVLVEDAQPIEYDQPLFLVDPA
ncbi:Biotin carboxyl carrier protein of acetyl-CoA carboxylase [Neolewinella maritima]|uniref:Biotin carboxyl carrier protein of acetyl-CoA carboxylase n=1 Tax=Neolewinella maritima TaxID=1383882 RepID=A0ABM9B2P3_9BACT|nr:acetyl-CoA carboxylase biotin carboxyl carrier protein [Neolewinella maritima]CAH1001604.1 Biotin carboxyl carrier protein of acetyl-CoA carboxylase [Neolewinella maritima]